MSPARETLKQTVARTPVADLPDLIGDLETAKVLAAERLRERRDDELLSVSEAAAATGLSRGTLYRRANELSFTRRVGSVLRFSAAGIEAWKQGRDRA